MRRHTGLQCIPQHTMLDHPLLQPQGLLSRFLLLLSLPIFLRLGLQPQMHRDILVRVLPLRRRML